MEKRADIALAASGGKLTVASAETAAFSVYGLTASYGDSPAVFSVDANFPAGAMAAILGPNGAGKSTMLKAALGIVPRVSGEAEVYGEPLDSSRDRVAYVPQLASVDWDFPARAIDVVQMGQYRHAGLFGRMDGELRGKAEGCLDRVGMADLAGRQIGRLSGGQRQRVFLARALAQEAELYLLDEPFAGVDTATEKAIVDVLKGLTDQGRTVVCVHHDLATVRDYFDHVFLINVRPVIEGPTAVAFTAEALNRAYGGRLAATYIGRLNLAEGA